MKLQLEVVNGGKSVYNGDRKDLLWRERICERKKSKHKRLFIPVINDIFRKDYPMVRRNLKS